MCLSHKLGLTAAVDVTLNTNRQLNTILINVHIFHQLYLSYYFISFLKRIQPSSPKKLGCYLKLKPNSVSQCFAFTNDNFSKSSIIHVVISFIDLHRNPTAELKQFNKQTKHFSFHNSDTHDHEWNHWSNKYPVGLNIGTNISSHQYLQLVVSIVYIPVYLISLQYIAVQYSVLFGSLCSTSAHYFEPQRLKPVSDNPFHTHPFHCYQLMFGMFQAGVFEALHNIARLLLTLSQLN